MWPVADFGEERRVEVQALTEIEAGRVERKVDEGGPEIQLIATAVTAVAEEGVVAEVDRKGIVGRVACAAERAGATPLVTTDSEGDVVQFFEHHTDRDQSAQGAVVQTRHARDLAGVRQTWARRRVPRRMRRAGRVGRDGLDTTCP